MKNFYYEPKCVDNNFLAHAKSYKYIRKYKNSKGKWVYVYTHPNKAVNAILKDSVESSQAKSNSEPTAAQRKVMELRVKQDLYKVSSQRKHDNAMKWIRNLFSGGKRKIRKYPGKKK